MTAMTTKGPNATTMDVSKIHVRNVDQLKAEHLAKSKLAT